MSRAADGSGRPTVGVIMAANNARSTVVPSVRSMIAQTVRPTQIIVVDDGSSDGTADLVESLASEHDGLVVIRSPHVGRAAARNLAISKLTTDLVAVQDADDIALPWRLEEALATLEAHPGAVAVGAQMLGFCRPGLAWELPRWPVDPAEIRGSFAAGTMAIAHPTAVMRRDAVLAAGGYDESFAYGEDLTLLMRLSESGAMASSSRDVTLYRKPRRHAFSHLYRTEVATRRARLLGTASPEPSIVSRFGALLAVTRVWLRQRIKPMPQKRPLADFDVDPDAIPAVGADV